MLSIDIQFPSLNRVSSLRSHPAIYFYHTDITGNTGYLSVTLRDQSGLVTGTRVVQHYQYMPFGEVFVHQNTQLHHNPYDFRAKERDVEMRSVLAYHKVKIDKHAKTGFHYFGARFYHASWGIFLTPDPLADLAPPLTPYRYAFNNPIRYHDPTGLFEVEKDGGDCCGGVQNTPRNLDGGQNHLPKPIQPIKLNNPTATLNQLQQQHRLELNLQTAQGSGGSLFGDILTGTEKHFNGGLGTVGVAVQGFNKIPNDVKRHYAYKLSKATGVKSGQIFQGAKSFANSTGKLVSKLGPVGMVLGISVIGNELKYDKWDAHTAVNAGLMIGAGVATFFSAPAVLTGIAIYGVGDYFFDFGGTIDRNLGRNSGIWKP